MFYTVNRFKKIIAGIIITGLLFVVINPAMAQNAPKATAIEPIKDAGNVFKGDKITHEFVIKNDGNAPLAITDVKPGCGCTTASFDKMISPGQTGKIKVIVDPSSFNGLINKIVTVYTNDTAHAEMQLTIQANIFAYVDAKPGFARYSIVQGDGEGTGPDKQVISSSDGTAFDITGSESDLPGTKVTYHEATASERLPGVAGKQWIVGITLPDNVPVGPIHSFVHLKTNHPRQPQVDIALSGVVRPLLSIIPATVDLGQITITEPLRKSIKVRSFATKEVYVTGAECNVKSIEVKYEPVTAGREYSIIITISPSVVKGAFDGKLIIHTDHPRAASVEVPLKGVIQ